MITDKQVHRGAATCLTPSGVIAALRKRARARPGMRGLQGVLALLLTLSGLAATPAQADGGISFSRNRMVYPASSSAISLDVINHGDTPYLIQAGVSADADKKVASPFVVTPPLFRLNGNAQNTLRLVGNGASLPKDRESVFYFYATAIPGQAKPDEAGKDNTGKAEGLGAQLSIAMRTVLKVFYRPTGLPVTDEQARTLVTFHQAGNTVEVNNPTPYYQSFGALSFDGVAQDLDRQPSMVAPFGTLRFAAERPVHTLTWRVMNDYGGMTPEKTETLTK